VEKYGKDYNSLHVCQYVSSRYENVNRFTTLGFKHHQIAAPFEDRLKWQKRTEAKLGELIKQEQEAGRLATSDSGRPKKGSTAGTLLKNYGLTKKDSHRAQKITEHKDLIPVVVAKP